jgi:hypothetical protein
MNPSTRPRPIIVAAAIGIALAVQSGAAAVKTRADFDKAFDFKPVRTWEWNPRGAGSVMVARTPDDDPEAIKRLAEPYIMDAVALEMPRRGLKQAPGMADIEVTYYLLLTVGAAAQTVGQFLPGVAEWGLPPFSPSTSSLEVIEQGSLVLDLGVKSQVVWRGVAQAKIQMGLERNKRAALIQEAVRELLKRYPPKK